MENGKIKKFMVLFNDTLSNYQIPKYDEKGYVTQIDLYTPKDSLFAKSIITNDAKGNYIKFENQDSKGNIRGKYLITRDVNSLITRREIYNKADSLIYVENNYYGDNHLMVNQESFRKGKPNPKWSYKYTYYPEGNWETQIASKEGKPMLFVERTYVYY